MTTEEIRAFLVTSPVFADVPADQLADVAKLFQAEKYEAGQLLLRQGGYSPAVYFVRSGRLAVKVQRGEWRETVAYIQPPDMAGELSFVTGRPCSADVEVVVDVEVLALPKEAVPKLPQQREALLRGLLRGVAERLHSTVSRGAKVPAAPVALLRRGAYWEAGESFPAALLESLARQTERETLLARIGGETDEAPRAVGARASQAAVRAADPVELRAEVARRITEWKTRFDNIVMDPVGPQAAAIVDLIDEFADVHGHLLGPGDPVPATLRDADFILQSAVRPTLPILSARRQLLFDGEAAEKAYAARAVLPPRFQRAVDSMARAIGGIQVGLALGGGAAWGWAHIGVLDALGKAGVPVDTISGCSMGSVIGALHCAGHSVESLREIAAYWKSRTRRFIEWRLWRMCLLNENVVRRVFSQYFGDLTVNQSEIPYWANAVDIQTGKEFAIRDGTMVECVRASIALPGLLPPARRDQHLLVDAGIMDPVPAHLARDMGAQYNVAVNAMAALEKAPISRHYPFNAFDIMTRCMFLMGHEIGQARAEQVANVLFTPSLGEITMLQFGRSAEIIDCGRRAAEEQLEGIVAGYEKLKKSRSSPELAAPARL
jgi:NTE family protein